jgi:hypothetical protein
MIVLIGEMSADGDALRFSTDGTQAKRTDMPRTYRGKVTAVGSNHLDGIQALRSRNYRCVDEPQLEVGVFSYEGFSTDNVFSLE